ncbi:MAG TPA: M1 family aminopeptidase [Pyrinomonadaceae bacterium]|jgi:aminopeptidase N|nr:M1 family aminopeptidase [Pyrinomonadaceae bacterium]
MQSLRSIRLAAKVFSFALALAFVVCPPLSGLTQTAAAQQAQPKLPPRQYIPDRSYDTQHIKLDLRFDWEREQALGTATISFKPLTTNLRNVEFDAANMTFSSVKLLAGAPLKYEADAQQEKLRITLDRAYQPADVITLVIAYNTNGVSKDTGIGGSGRGLTFIKPNAEEPARPKQIWSQGETEYNHYWFPCYDHPNDFSTTEISATVEKPLMVISNGRLVETRLNKDGTRTFHWKIETPHASYLTSIVVGEYAAVEGIYAGIPVITYVYPNEIEEGKVTAARLPEMVRFFSEKTGLKYPYAKYAQTVTRDFGGGMENISATTQTDNMIHDARTTLDRDQDGLQSHELAHQWFGDYVTCRYWSDIWLNESFATYFQAMWDEHRYGRDDFLYRDVKGNQDTYYATWAQGNNRRPIVTGNYQDKDAIFDTYAYPRGGAVLHMLRKTLGEDNWWRSINHYLRKYANQPVQTEEFRIAIEETTGQPMEWFFEQWLYRMGHPVFRVTQSYDAGAGALTLKVRQEQTPDPNSGYPQVGFFRAPVEIEIGTNGTTRIERVWIEPKEEQTFTFKVDSQPTLVNFDYGSTLIKELKFDKTADELAYQLARDEDVAGRLWALGQLSNRLKNVATADAEKQKIAAALGSALNNDKFWGVRVDVATALGNSPDAAARTALLTATKDKDARVRVSAINALAKSKDPTLASVYQQFLSDQSYATISAAANALGETKSPDAYDALTKLISVPSWHDQIQAYGLSGLARLEDKRALEIGIRYASGGQTQVRAAALRLLGTAGKGDERAFQIVSKALLGAASRRDFQIAAAAGDSLVKLNDPRGVEILEQGVKAANNPQFQGFLRQFQQRLRQPAPPAAKSSGQ